MTDGLLLAEIQRDRLLRRYDTIIVDEAHERTLNIDFLLGYLQRILPRRPDLKVIITSATIDPERFAEHFGDAPVVEVSGRTYPVEVRYRPLATRRGRPRPGRRDRRRRRRAAARGAPATSSCSSAASARSATPPTRCAAGCAPTSRSCRCTRGCRPPSSSACPSRTPAAAIVLATNVAETSLTVPGIRYVVDPGTARISRYSARLKVQRLPIEPISQASADQRKGRCGRVAEGICIRLYSEEDFDARPRFTDPEILRTSLAAVILQMAALGLGEVEDFPFLDPPDRRQVRDGLALLQELGALEREGARARPAADEARAPARAAAGRPADGPHGARGRPLGCCDEVIVIAAALSIQDPRERPPTRRRRPTSARAVRRRRLGLPRLPQPVALPARAAARAVGQPVPQAVQGRVPALPAGPRVAGPRRQLRQAARRAGMTLNRDPAEPDEIHRALLAGLLSHIGLKDAPRREYLGARGRAFAIFPGSALAKGQPRWVMAAELVETSRLWGARPRDRARVDRAARRAPRQAHVQRAALGRASAGAVVATERVTLYGLPIVAGRTVAYGRIDPALSRELFIRRALVEGDWDTRHRFFAENRALLDEVEELEARARRRDILVDDDALCEFFDQRVPADVVSGRALRPLVAGRAARDPDLLTFTRSCSSRRRALDPTRARRAGGSGDVALRADVPLRARATDDGVTVHVPLAVLAQLRADGSTGSSRGCVRARDGAAARRCPRTCAACSRRSPRPPRAPRRALGGPLARRSLPRWRASSSACAGAGSSRRDFDLAALSPHLRVDLPRRRRGRSGAGRRQRSRRAARAAAPAAARELRPRRRSSAPG